jgi:hypothetical protein
MAPPGEVELKASAVKTGLRIWRQEAATYGRRDARRYKFANRRSSTAQE